MNTNDVSKKESNNLLIEVCCGSLDDALAAEKGNADRIELNSALFLGGLTPSLGTLREAAAQIHIPIMAMVRPRGAGFQYTENELTVMERDIEGAFENGAAGVVFGVLDETGCVDRKACERLIKRCEGRPAVFHRAIDVVPDVKAALDMLIDLGFCRVLSSGQRPTVPEGLGVLRDMINYADGRIEILPGAGISCDNLSWVVDQTGCNQVHIAPFKSVADVSTCHNQSIFFGGALYPPEDRYDAIDADGVAALRKK